MTNDAHDKEHEITGLWDKDNPKSVYNRVPKGMQAAMDAIPDDMRYKSESSLRSAAKPPPKLANARVQFWAMYAAHPDNPISMNQAFNHSKGTYADMLRNPRRLMWFLTPPDDAMDTQKVMLAHTLELLQSALRDENLYVIREKIKKHKDGVEEKTITKELNVRAISEIRRLADDLHSRITGSTNVKVRNAIMVNGGMQDFTQLQSAGQILDMASDPDEQDVFSRPSNKAATMDNSSDLSEFMDENNE